MKKLRVCLLFQAGLLLTVATNAQAFGTFGCDVPKTFEKALSCIQKGKVLEASFQLCGNGIEDWDVANNPQAAVGYCDQALAHSGGRKDLQGGILYQKSLILAGYSRRFRNPQWQQRTFPPIDLEASVKTAKSVGAPAAYDLYIYIANRYCDADGKLSVTPCSTANAEWAVKLLAAVEANNRSLGYAEFANQMAARISKVQQLTVTTSTLSPSAPSTPQSLAGPFGNTQSSSVPQTTVACPSGTVAMYLEQFKQIACVASPVSSQGGSPQPSTAQTSAVPNNLPSAPSPAYVGAQPSQPLHAHQPQATYQAPAQPAYDPYAAQQREMQERQMKLQEKQLAISECETSAQTCSAECETSLGKNAMVHGIGLLMGGSSYDPNAGQMVLSSTCVQTCDQTRSECLARAAR